MTLLTDTTKDYIMQYEIEESLEKDHIVSLRRKIEIALSHQRVLPDIRQKFCLSFAEIFSNLIAHPKEKPNKIKVEIYKTSKNLTLLIKDNSSPFIDFQDKMTESIQTMEYDKFSLSGRGLGLIHKQHSEYRYIPKTQSDDQYNHFYTYEALENAFQNPADQNEQTNQSKIFIIDDDYIYLEMIKAILEDNYQICTFLSGKDALEAFPKERPDLIISDFNMPNMNGAQLRTALSKLESGNATPFIFLSGNKDIAKEHYINQLGIDDFIYKPVEKEYLYRIIIRSIARSSQIKKAISGQVGRDITTMLKPSLPKNIKGWKTCVKTRAADHGGGDFILQATQNQGCTIVLSDVMGHGLPAKFLAYAYAGYLRSLFRLYSTEQDPSAFLQTLSTAVHDDEFLDQHIITCLSLWIEPNGQAKVACAGHPWPVYVSRKEAHDTHYINASGPLIGLTPKSKYKSVDVTLEQGDRLIIYTDGLVEDKSSPGDYNINQEKLLSYAQEKTDLTLSKYTEYIWNKMMKNIDVVNDDITLAILEYSNEEQ